MVVGKSLFGSMRAARMARAGVIAVSMGMLAMAGCSSNEPQAAAQPQVEAAAPLANATFALDKCEQLQPNLFKCPAIDQNLCTPEFNRSDVSCVRIGPKGSVFVKRGGMM